jgi:hypothetical protein
MNKKKLRAQASDVVSEQVALELVFPVLAFLQASGMSMKRAEVTFHKAWNRALRVKHSVSISNLQDANDYAEVVGLWTKHPDYVDTKGIPRKLTYRGKRGFHKLVQRASQKLAPADALAVLTKYGNVEKTKAGTLSLVRPFFHVRSTDNLAFEPSARFLSAASATVANVLGKQQSYGGLPRLFWRTADTDKLPASAIPSYMDFARSRSLIFLQEIDEWLQAHVTTLSKGKCRRVGLGLFSICETRDAPGTPRVR